MRNWRRHILNTKDKLIGNQMHFVSDSCDFVSDNLRIIKNIRIFIYNL